MKQDKDIILMKQVVIENPILNSPFKEPNRHFRFSEEGITDEIVDSRRVSSYFIPIARSKKQGKQLQLPFDTEWTQDRIEENKFINQIRLRVKLWRHGGYLGITKTTASLLAYWTNSERDRKLFFCQIEALETAIYITEVAKKYGDTWIENNLNLAKDDANSLLYRVAFKMATGSGKTVVMAMLVAWHALNKSANPQDTRFSDTFLFVTPGITIRDRLRVLLPNDPQNYYSQRDIVPPGLMEDLNKTKILIINRHTFKLRELATAGKLTKSILAHGGISQLTETPDQMVRRVCRELGNKRNIVVINDEAHHCYQRKPENIEEKMTNEELQEVKEREEEAQMWSSGLEAIQSKIGIKVVYDLSATPFFLRGSGYPEGTLFPWVVSDFSLIDAIESGIVKIPRVPVADDSMNGDQPTYRDLWLRIREGLPKRGRKTETLGDELHLPAELQGALHSLYSNYEKYYRLWERSSNEMSDNMTLTPPVFIIVCNNTNVSKLVFDYVAGRERSLQNGSSVIIPGQLPIFNNEENGIWKAWPNTILIDSQQLESGEAMSPEFKKIASAEIEEFKAEYSTRFPDRDINDINDEDLLREVMNTVGKVGKLGEQVKCVISVSMLTEGWDANTVTHILGVRAFGTQLLCEQVVGRGLRRTSYIPNKEEMFDPEYAEVYGVPFSFIPCSGATKDPVPSQMPTRVRALSERLSCEITFPRLIGYRYEVLEEKLTVDFTQSSMLVLSTKDIPTRTENAPIVGESSIHTLDDLKRRREQEIAFLIAKLVLEKYFQDDAGGTKTWLFPQLLRITKEWLDKCVRCKDNAFLQLLLLIEFAHDASDRIYQAIASAERSDRTLKPTLRPYDFIGSTRFVSFDTTRPVYATNPTKCHISHVVLDSSWEGKMAQVLEEMNEVVCYVKNHGLGFAIPYTLDGQEKNYIPDFIVRINDGRGQEDLLNLLIEVSGEKRKDKDAKVATASNLWVPAVNNYRNFGRWDFLEINDPWNAKDSIRSKFHSKTDQLTDPLLF